MAIAILPDWAHL